jgi:hypothetical protein
MSIRPFTRELRKLGFELDFRDRSGGTVCTQFKLRKGDRELHVQFWADGHHRVAHGTHGLHGLHECTPPTEFETVPHMLTAIDYEWIRASGPLIKLASD